MYDAIVVGARCAGSPTAMLLAHRGYRVLLLDRATFPSDAVSAHHVTVPGVARLARWGLLDTVVASGCPPIRRMTVRLGDFTFRGTPTPIEGIADQYCVRRTVLDTVLVDAAAEAGAEIREGFVVEELLFDGDRVAGIRGRAPGGGDVVERARLVVGADGLHSQVAEAVAPRSTVSAPRSPAAPMPTGVASTSKTPSFMLSTAGQSPPFPPTTASSASRCNGRRPRHRRSGRGSKRTSSRPCAWLRRLPTGWRLVLGPARS